MSHLEYRWRHPLRGNQFARSKPDIVSGVKNLFVFIIVVGLSLTKFPCPTVFFDFALYEMHRTYSAIVPIP